ncbi:unnamed protein product [Rotaria sp. Silwood1]|nr:unnamed protein product [Rotaria sp. Silwood1]
MAYYIITQMCIRTSHTQVYFCLTLIHIHLHIMARIQLILLAVFFAFLFITNTSVNGQCVTWWQSGGCCRASHRQRCVVNGMKLCCSVQRELGRTTQMDTDESTSPRYNLDSN